MPSPRGETQGTAEHPSQKEYAGGAPTGSPTPAQVVWITGFSAAGKTTVARQVEALLRERNARAVFLDGDELRSIFADRWGYSREERIALARVYFGLSSLLASQGTMVVISAVAMYDEVRDWLRAHVPGAVEIYLEVPEEERRKRDRATKQVYDRLGSLEDMYDEPVDSDLLVPNHGGVSPAEAASRIVAFLEQDHATKADHGRQAHWEQFYSGGTAPMEPSSFARFTAEQVQPAGRLLEVGCGNGRDAVFLSGVGFDVMALDIAGEAIQACISSHGSHAIEFVASTIGGLNQREADFQVVYSRFSLHAMTPEEEDEFLAESAARLRSGGRLFIECRSINDPLARKGEVISRTERLHGHYRRFVVPNELHAKLGAIGFRPDSMQEARGVAKLGDDDPVVVRVAATKP